MDSTSPAADWTHRPERGSLALVRFMAWFSLTIGRAASRVLLRVITLYFFVASPAARRESRAFLRRCLGREPRLGERFGVFLAFASTTHDRLFFLCDRYEEFEVAVHDAGLLPPGGAILMGAHLGSFEAMRAAGRHHGNRRVAMAMYEENARRFNGVLAALNPAAVRDIVPLGHLESMLALRARLDAGDLVGVLADRTLGGEAVVRIPFLGEPAPFPTGPMRMAAALRQRVFLMVGLYRGGNRYEVRFEELADFRDAGDRGARDKAVLLAVERYAGRLEHYCREAPDNWFNFHDFWGSR